jgi:DNA-binding beta-propeller fold protein YncE
MAAGLFVQIDRVLADNFPLVTLEVQVQDRRRRPIAGLDARNFVLSEAGRTVSEQTFLGAGYRSETADMAILVERSPRTASLGTDLEAAVRDIEAAGGRVVSLISAGEQPVRERIGGANPTDINPTDGQAAAAQEGRSAYSPRWRFDLGLRLAATDLLAGAKKRGVVFISGGALGELAFEQYGLSALAAYLANNSIVFYAVILGSESAAEELRYLCEQTGGQAVSLYRPEGIGPVLKGLASQSSGSYTLSYRSALPTDFGRAYLPVEAEVYLLERSGRDSTGYFPPLQ